MDGGLGAFDYSPPGGVPGILMSFLSDSGGSPAARESSLKRSLCTSAGFCADNVDYTEQLWSPTHETGTSNVVQYMAPSTLSSEAGKAWLSPREGRLHFAGSDTSKVWMGYIDGAVRSGQRVARDIAAEGFGTTTTKRVAGEI